MARRYSKIGVNIAVPLWLTGAAGVGIALEAPIFVAVTLLFALVAYLGAALEAWTRRHPVNKSVRADIISAATEPWKSG
jgi:hypothetical protein